MTSDFQSRPAPLQYAKPRTIGAFPTKRLIWWAICTIVPFALLVTWAELGVRWLERTGKINSGYPAEGIYEPMFFERPMLIGTVIYAAMSLLALTQVMSRKWPRAWLLALPVLFVVWLSLMGWLIHLAMYAFD
jgi:hypothetical protein